MSEEKRGPGRPAKTETLEPVVHVAHFQAGILLPAGGGTKTEIVSSKDKAIAMKWCADGLLVTHKGVTALVPATNVKCVHFAN